jgi:hypothetical protein
MPRSARPSRDPAEVHVAVHRGGHHGRRAGGHPAGPCRDRRRRRRVAGQAATMTAGIQPTAMMGVQLCCLMASTIELTATSTTASAAMAYSHRVHGLMSNIPSVKCPCHNGPACGRSPELSALSAVTAWTEPWLSPGRVWGWVMGCPFVYAASVTWPVRCGAPQAGRCSLIWTVGADRAGGIARRGRYGWNLVPGAAAARPWWAASKEVGQGRSSGRTSVKTTKRSAIAAQKISEGCFRQSGRGSSVWLASASRAAVRSGAAGRRNDAPVPAPGCRAGCSRG